MAKSFKLRISRVITTTFQSCRSKDPSTLPQDPVPSFFQFSPVNRKLLTVDHFPLTTTPNKPQSHRSSIRRHVSSAFISVGCGYTSSKPAATKDCDDHRTRSSSQQQEFSWKQEEKWHVVAKIYEDDKNQTPRQKVYNSSASGGSDHDEILALPPPPPPSKKKRRGKKKKIPSRLRMSTSSAESGLFSSEVGELIFDDQEDGEGESLIETETLISSSRSFSTTDDSSSDFISPHQLESIREKPPHVTRRHKRISKKKSKKHLMKSSVSRTIYRPSSAENDSPARLSVFKKLIPCSVDGKVKESFAIVKKSEDPYEDFKRSMMEMILEKQMFEKRDLEQLLQCFLSLNSRHYHGLIIEVFAEIWEAMFCATDDPSSSCRRHRRCVNGRNNLRV